MTNTANSKLTMKRVVVVGGGTAGWMTAAGIASLLGKAGIDLTLIESEDIGIVGVGEATLPHLKFFNDTIGIDEGEFLAATSATIKLGIEFVNWGRVGDRYIHPFGEYGIPNDGVGFHHYWRRFKDREGVGRLSDYSLPVLMCEAGRFVPPTDDLRKVTSTYRYAYQFDATKYAPFLRKHAEARGARRIEGKVVGVNQCADTGNITDVELESGRTIEGDLFIDCTGFRGLLIEQALKTGYTDWTHWLPCDRAVAAPCAHAGPLLPYTRATARDAGWQWRIPLQHRTGNGHVYSSAFLDDQQAVDQLVTSLEGELHADPRLLRFVTGRRNMLWHKNCVAIGLSGGFLEPLESTSIYLIQQGLTYLIEQYPLTSDMDAQRCEYNRLMELEFDRVRDFLILHYHATERDDTPFWQAMRAMTVPSSLQEKMALFRQRGRVQTYDHGLFLEPSWLAVYFGQRVMPEAVDLRAEEASESDVVPHLKELARHIHDAVPMMPTHEQWLARRMSGHPKVGVR